MGRQATRFRRNRGRYLDELVTTFIGAATFVGSIATLLPSGDVPGSVMTTVSLLVAALAFLWVARRRSVMPLHRKGA